MIIVMKTKEVVEVTMEETMAEEVGEMQEAAEMIEMVAVDTKEEVVMVEVEEVVVEAMEVDEETIQSKTTQKILDSSLEVFMVVKLKNKQEKSLGNSVKSLTLL